MPMIKVALITSIASQGGRLSGRIPVEKDYEVHGIKRRTSLFNTARIDYLYQDPHERDVALWRDFAEQRATRGW